MKTVKVDNVEFNEDVVIAALKAQGNWPIFRVGQVLKLTSTNELRLVLCLEGSPDLQLIDSFGFNRNVFPQNDITHNNMYKVMGNCKGFIWE